MFELIPKIAYIYDKKRVELQALAAKELGDLRTRGALQPLHVQGPLHPPQRAEVRALIQGPQS